MAKDKSEKIQVLLTEEDLTALNKKIAKKAASTGDAAESISHYVRRLIKRDISRPQGD